MSQEITLNEVLIKVEAWDLEKTKRILVANETWSERLCTEVDPIYRRLMTLKGFYPTEVLIPPTAIDTFWHAHMLDSMAYAEDCQNAFGRFIHHMPFDPAELTPELRNEEQVNRTKTLILYVASFGELNPYSRSVWENPYPLKIDFAYMDRIGVGSRSAKTSSSTSSSQSTTRGLNNFGPPACR